MTEKFSASSFGNVLRISCPPISASLLPSDGVVSSGRMVSGLEVMIGVRDDPWFGPFVVLGLGGVLVEAVRDVAFRLLPLTRADVTDMIKELRGNVLFGRYRGSPPRDVDALIEAVMGLSIAYQILCGDISDIEINPLMVGAAGEGVCAVDIRTVARQYP